MCLLCGRVVDMCWLSAPVLLLFLHMGSSFSPQDQINSFCPGADNGACSDVATATSGSWNPSNANILLPYLFLFIKKKTWIIGYNAFELEVGVGPDSEQKQESKPTLIWLWNRCGSNGSNNDDFIQINTNHSMVLVLWPNHSMFWPNHSMVWHMVRSGTPVLNRVHLRTKP